MYLMVAGIPGISDKLLEKYAVRVVSYDRPGIGQSDPHPKRNYNTSAQDMAYIADVLGMGDKFWVLGYSAGGAHAWAALHYIPNRLAGTPPVHFSSSSPQYKVGIFFFVLLSSVSTKLSGPNVVTHIL